MTASARPRRKRRQDDRIPLRGLPPEGVLLSGDPRAKLPGARVTYAVAWQRGVSLCVYALRLLPNEAPGDGLAWLYVDGGYLDGPACRRLVGVVAPLMGEAPGTPTPGIATPPAASPSSYPPYDP